MSTILIILAYFAVINVLAFAWRFVFFLCDKARRIKRGSVNPEGFSLEQSLQAYLQASGWHGLLTDDELREARRVMEAANPGRRCEQ